MSVMESSFESMKYSFLSRDRKRGDMMAVVLLDGVTWCWDGCYGQDNSGDGHGVAVAQALWQMDHVS